MDAWSGCYEEHGGCRGSGTPTEARYARFSRAGWVPRPRFPGCSTQRVGRLPVKIETMQRRRGMNGGSMFERRSPSTLPLGVVVLITSRVRSCLVSGLRGRGCSPGNAWSGGRLLPSPVARSVFLRSRSGVAPSPGFLKLLLPPVHLEEPLLDLAVGEPGAVPPEFLCALADLPPGAFVHEPAGACRCRTAASATTRGRRLRSLCSCSCAPRVTTLSFLPGTAIHHTRDASPRPWKLSTAEGRGATPRISPLARGYRSPGGRTGSMLRGSSGEAPGQHAHIPNAASP